MKFFKVNAVVPNTPEDPADGCQIHQELNLAYDKYNVKGLPNCVTDRYVVTKTYSNGVATSKVLAGVRSVEKRSHWIRMMLMLSLL